MGSKWIKKMTPEGGHYENIAFGMEGEPDLIAPFPGGIPPASEFNHDLGVYSKIQFSEGMRGGRLSHGVELHHGIDVISIPFMHEEAWTHLHSEVLRRADEEAEEQGLSPVVM